MLKSYLPCAMVLHTAVPILESHGGTVRPSFTTKGAPEWAHSRPGLCASTDTHSKAWPRTCPHLIKFEFD